MSCLDVELEVSDLGLNGMMRLPFTAEAVNLAGAFLSACAFWTKAPKTLDIFVC